MKKLFLLRHAKSSWKNTTLPDFERPLSKRGLADAPFMAAKFMRRNINLNLIISSSAIRTAETAQIFVNVLNYKKAITFRDELYLASAGEILNIIKQLDDNNRMVLIICHNPGITDLANFLDSTYIENIPTSGIIGFTFDGYWKDLNKNCCKSLFFDFPKNDSNH